MKQFIFILLAFVTFCGTANADNPDQVITDSKIVNPGGQNGNMPRGPITYPNVYQDGHVFTADSMCYGETLRLVQGDVVVCEYPILEENGGEVVIPNYINGIFELQVQIGDIIFYGFVTL